MYVSSTTYTYTKVSEPVLILSYEVITLPVHSAKVCGEILSLIIIPISLGLHILLMNNKQTPKLLLSQIKTIWKYTLRFTLIRYTYKSRLVKIWAPDPLYLLPRISPLILILRNLKVLWYKLCLFYYLQSGVRKFYIRDLPKRL